MRQDDFLAALKYAQVPVTIFLVSGIRLQGIVESSDQYGVLLGGNSQQFIFKRAISTIVPSREVTARAAPAAATLPHGNPPIDSSSPDSKLAISEIADEKTAPVAVAPVVRVKRTGGTKLKLSKSEPN